MQEAGAWESLFCVLLPYACDVSGIRFAIEGLLECSLEACRGSRRDSGEARKDEAGVSA